MRIAFCQDVSCAGHESNASVEGRSPHQKQQRLRHQSSCHQQDMSCAFHESNALVKKEKPTGSSSARCSRVAAAMVAVVAPVMVVAVLVAPVVPQQASAVAIMVICMPCSGPHMTQAASAVYMPPMSTHAGGHEEPELPGHIMRSNL